MTDANERVDSRYKKGYLDAYRAALWAIRQGASVDELRKFVAEELERWNADSELWESAPTFRRK